MTTADDYVIKFIQDKGLVSPADVNEARAATTPVPDGQNPDTLAIAKLVETGKVAWPQITAPTPPRARAPRRRSSPTTAR